MTQEFAEKIALDALAWLAASDTLMPIFLGSTGAGADDIRHASGEPGFLASILEFITMDDAWVIEFCDHAGHKYDQPIMARAILAGEAGMHWT